MGDHRFTADVPDVRGADVYGPEDEKFGNIEDVIFDHETMEIRFVVMEGGGKFKTFWEEDPVMHRRGSDRIVTPTPEELRASENVGDRDADAGQASGDLEFLRANFFPSGLQTRSPTLHQAHIK